MSTHVGESLFSTGTKKYLLFGSELWIVVHVVYLSMLVFVMSGVQEKNFRPSIFNIGHLKHDFAWHDIHVPVIVITTFDEINHSTLNLALISV